MNFRKKSDSEPKPSSFWQSPQYVSWLTADTAAVVGLTLRTLAITLTGYAVSHSTVAAGWLGTLSMVAQQIANIFGGTNVDRHDRRRIILVHAIIGTLSWGTVFVLLLCDMLSYLQLLCISVFASFVGGFLGGATDAILRSIIAVRDYPKARSINEGRDAAISMAASPMSGLLYSFQPWLPFLLSAVAYAISGVAATKINYNAKSYASGTDVADNISNQRGLHNKARNSRAKSSTFAHDFLSGWAWTIHRKLIVRIVVAAALTNFGVNGLQYTIQLYFVSISTSAVAIGVLNGGIACSMVIGAYIAYRIATKAHVGHTVCVAFVSMCLCAMPMIWSNNYWVVLISNALIGLPTPMINALLLGFIFAKSPVDMQGRVATTLTTPAQALSSFCSVIAGILLTHYGFYTSVIFFVGILGVSCAVILTDRSIRSIPQAYRWDTVSL